jgi:hypothetical protein
VEFCWAAQKHSRQMVDDLMSDLTQKLADLRSKLKNDWGPSHSSTMGSKASSPVLQEAYGLRSCSKVPTWEVKERRVLRAEPELRLKGSSDPL